MAILPNIPEESLYISSKVTTGEAFTQKGVLAAVKTADGLAYNATATMTGAKIIGIAFDAYAITTTGVFRKGTFRFTNSTTHAIAAKDIGSVCEVEDNVTVCVAGTSTWAHPVIAGTVAGVDSNGVFVNVGVDNSVTVSAS